MSQTPVRDLSILLIEDDPGDQWLLQKALAGQPLTQVHVCHDGDSALAHLGESIPDLILLDLRLPGPDGFEILEWIRGRESHAATPVVVLTGAATEQERERAYALDATTFVQKPDRPEDLVSLVRAINDFWIRTVVTRSRPRSGDQSNP